LVFNTFPLSFLEVLRHLDHPTLNSLSKDSFWKLRVISKNDNPINYIVISNNPTDDLVEKMWSGSEKVKTVLITNTNAEVSDKLNKATEVIRLGKEKVDLNSLSDFLFKRELMKVLVEGGPTLMGQFLKHDLLDEVFLTIAPKIIGNNRNTLTMVENELLSPEKVAEFRLLSNIAVEDEIYIRYKKK